MAQPRTAPRKKRKYHKEHSKRSLTKRATDRASRLENIEAAVAWCKRTGKGAKAAVKTKKFPGVSYNHVHPRLKGRRSLPSSDPRSQPTQIMTDTERKQVAKWIMECADGGKPRYRVDITKKIKEILRYRKASNKKRKHGKGTIKLNRNEREVLASSETELSSTFFSHFYAWCQARDIGINEGTPKTAEVKRVEKMTEATVKRHFSGKYGLEVELIAAGVMDADSKEIIDLRRLLNCDETPQPADVAQRGKRKKAAKRKGKAVKAPRNINRESITVTMCWDASGHNYGPQIVIKRKTLSESYATEAPNGARQFDDATDVVRQQSRYLSLARTAEGMQTAESFIDYLECIDKQITARSDAEVAAGGEPIERPVVLMLDNHASRFSAEVLEAAGQAQSRLGMRLFTEEPNTSHFLQPLDQYNSKFHRAYNKAKDAYKEAYAAKYKNDDGTPAECSIGLKEFLAILGGDDDLGLPGMWFTWADPFDIVTAFRKVGIAGRKLVPELIDRTDFLPEAPSSAEGSPEPKKRARDVAKTPEGMVSGSVESERAKVKSLLEYAEQLEKQLDAPFDPEAAGLLAPERIPDRKRKDGKKRSRLSDMSGSVTLRNVLGEKRARDEEDQAAADAAKAKRAAIAAKKDAVAREQAEKIRGFEACEKRCTCGRRSQVCPYAKWVRCPTCGPKPGVCKARACVAARKPLLLTYNSRT